MTSIISGRAGGPTSPCEPLIALATAEIYARNPFRVLGVGVDASRQDIERVQRRRAMQAKLGLGGAEDDGVFPVEADPQADRAALEALGRPVDRFLYELFWFWPLDGDDEALDALDRGDAAGAVAAWERGIDNDPVAARHNLAVLHHALALSESDTSRAATDARRALELWSVLAGERSFWRAVEARATAIGDRQVSPDLVEQVQGTFPTAILLIHANRAVDLARSGSGPKARDQIDLVRGSGFDSDSREAALRRALSPARRRLTGTIDRARARWEAAPATGADEVRELERIGMVIVQLIDLLLPEDDLTRRGVHDDLAEALADGIIAYGNTTEDWSRAAELLGTIIDIAVGDTIRERIERNRSVCLENAEEWNHWCAPGYWELPGDVVDALQVARQHADAGDFGAAIERLVDMDPDIGPPLTRALAFSLSKEALRLYSDREASGRRLEGLRLAGEYLILADELDPDHHVITNQLSQVRTELSLLGESMPSSGSLRTRLHGSRSRGEEVVEPPVTAPSTCHFCGERAPVAAASIEVPMCGEVTTIRYALGPGHSYRYRTVTVPRCEECRSAHEDLPDRVEAWRGGLTLSGAEEGFPDLLQTVRHLTEDQEDAAHTLEQAETRRSAAQAAVEVAVTGPTSCDRCGGTDDWDDGLCRACDGELYRVGGRDTLLAAGIAGAAFLNLFFGSGTVLIQRIAETLAGPGGSAVRTAGVAAFGGVGVIGLGLGLLLFGLATRRRAERDELRNERREAFAAEASRKGEQARLELAEAERAHAEAESVLRHPRERLEEARAELDKAREEARARYERECPCPELPPGVAPESDYLTHPTITDLQSRAWGFGSEPLTDNGSVSTRPMDVTGLVS